MFFFTSSSLLDPGGITLQSTRFGCADPIENYDLELAFVSGSATGSLGEGSLIS
jgi:hypothetical protein